MHGERASCTVDTRGHDGAGADETQISGAVPLPVGTDAGQQVVACGNAAAMQRDIAPRRHDAAQCEGCRAGDRDRALTIDRRGLAARHALKRTNGDRARGTGRTAQRHLPLGIQADIARLCLQRALAVDAHAGFRTDQRDLVGIHAPQRRHVQRELRGQTRGAARRQRAGGLVGIADLIDAGNQVDVLGVERGVDLDRACPDVHLRQVAGVEATTVDRYRALSHPETRQRALAIQHRHAGGQRGTRRVDETAAVATDPVGIGHYHGRLQAGHLDIAIELARRCRGHLIDDDLRRPARLQVCIAQDVAAQLRRGRAGRVVEDDAVRADVELAVGVERDVVAVGCGDVDDRHIVAGHAGGRVRGTAGHLLGKRAADQVQAQCQRQRRDAQPGHAPRRTSLADRTRRPSLTLLSHHPSPCAASRPPSPPSVAGMRGYNIIDIAACATGPWPGIQAGRTSGQASERFHCRCVPNASW